MASSSKLRRLTVLAAVIGLLGLVGPAASYAQTAPSTTTTTSTTRAHDGAYAAFRVAPTTDLVAGSVIAVTADAHLGFITSLSARICRPETCAVAPPTPDSDAAVSVAASGTGPSTGLSLRLRAGIGTFGADNGGSFVCDAANPCQLAVSASMNVGGGSNQRFPLTYAQTAPTTTSTSTTTTTTTTTPPSPLCAVRDRLPRWLWTLLVRILGVTC
jgi:hypothetical protein